MIQKIAERFNLNGRFNVKRVMKENQINDRFYELENASKIALEELEQNSLLNQNAINDNSNKVEVLTNKYDEKAEKTKILTFANSITGFGNNYPHRAFELVAVDTSAPSLFCHYLGFTNAHGELMTLSLIKNLNLVVSHNEHGSISISGGTNNAEVKITLF